MPPRTQPRRKPARKKGWNQGWKPDGPMTVAERNAVLEQWLAEYPRPIKLLQHSYPTIARMAIRLLGEDEANALCLFGGVRAARLFDPGRGFKFPTFAEFHIMAVVRRQVERRMVVEQREVSMVVTSPHHYRRDGDAEMQFADHRETDPAVLATDHTLRDRVRGVVARSTPCPRTREIADLRWGLAGGEPLSLERTAEHFGISRERVRQIEQSLLKKVRPHLLPFWERLTANS